MPANHKNVLWDHRVFGSSELCHPTRTRNVSVILKDRTVGLASRTLERMHKNEGICLGSVNADKSSEGLVVTVDDFEEQQRQPKLMLAGDFQVPITFWKKSSLTKAKTAEDYFSDLKSLLRQCGERCDVDLSNVLKLEIKCQLEGPQCSVQLEALMPSTTFKIVAIPQVPVAATSLYNSLTKNSRQSLPRSGLITLDQYQKIVYILENDPRVSTSQLVGLWVSGVDVVHDPYVWAACLRYITCPAYICRICFPPKPFLLALCTTVSLEPEYYDCFALGGTDFTLLNGRACLTVTKVPSFGSHITVVDLFTESDAGKLKSFSEAKSLLLKERSEVMSSQKPVTDIQSNVDDFPRMTPVAQQLQNIEFKPLVPDVSLLSEPGSGNAMPYGKEKLTDDYTVLVKKHPLQTINMNSQQVLSNSGVSRKADPFYCRNPLVNINSKVINAKSKVLSPNMCCNDENEPPLPEKSPRPYSIPEMQPQGPSAMMNTRLPIGITKHPRNTVRHISPTHISISPKENSNIPLDTPKRFVPPPIGRQLQSSSTTMAEHYGVHNTGVDGISVVSNGTVTHCHPHYMYSQRTLLSQGNKGTSAGSIHLSAANCPISSDFTNAEKGCIPSTDKAQGNVQFFPTVHTIAQKTYVADKYKVLNINCTSPAASYPSQNAVAVCGISNQHSSERSTQLTNLQTSNSHGNQCNAEISPQLRNLQMSNSHSNQRAGERSTCTPLSNLETYSCNSDTCKQCNTERSTQLTDLQTSNSVGQVDQPGMRVDCQEKTDITNTGTENPQPISSLSFRKENESFEIQKIIEQQDNKLKLLQEQIQLLLQAQTLEEKGESQHPSPSRKGEILEDEEKLEVYKMLKHQDEQLQLLQEQIKTVLELHQSSPNNRRRSSDSGLEESPSNSLHKPRCTVGIVPNVCGETQPKGCESFKNGHHCEHQKIIASTCSRAYCRENNNQQCVKCDGCSCGNQSNTQNSSLTLKSLNIPTVCELPPSLPPSFQVDMKDYDGSCCLSQTSREVANGSPVFGESVSYFRDEVPRRTGSSDESYEDVERGDTFCQKLLGNINCVLKQRDVEKSGMENEFERYGFDSFLLPKLNYQTFHLSNVDSDLGDLALKYLGEQQIKATMSSTKMILEHKLVQNNVQPSDTTLYGLSSSNISYSTKMYLERYGLMPSGGNPQIEQGASEAQSFWIFSDVRKLRNTSQGVINTDTSKILDLEALKRQPKLL